MGFYFKNYGRNFDGLAFRWEEETLFSLSLSLSQNDSQGMRKNWAKNVKCEFIKGEKKKDTCHFHT